MEAVTVQPFLLVNQMHPHRECSFQTCPLDSTAYALNAGTDSWSTFLQG